MISSASVGERHAGAIDGLVAEPGAVELLGVEINDGLLDGLVEHFEIDLEAERGGEFEALDIVADEEAAHGESAIGTAADDGEHVDDRQVAEEVVGGVVEDVADWIVGSAHDALHAVDGAEIMAAVDAFAAAGPDQDVLVVVGHADDFVGHDLADGEDQIEAALRDAAD